MPRSAGEGSARQLGARRSALLPPRRLLASAAPPRGAPHRRGPVSPRALTLTQEEVTIGTPTGPMRCFVFRPAAPGKYPGLLLYSEIFQVTGPIRRSAQVFFFGGGDGSFRR